MWCKGGDMPNYTTILLLYLAALNVVTFFVYGIDKWKARHKRWRIPEAALLLLALLGSSVGAWLGMYVWRHKTQHKKFKYGVPLILLVQVAIMSACKSGIDFANIQTELQFIIN